jgi:hypothetical protein
MQNLFNPEVSDDIVLEQLRHMRFIPLGEGHAARVYADPEHRLVLKVFPPLRIGSAREVRFIDRNPLLRRLERLSVRWEETAAVRWLRSKAKAALARWLSRRNPEARRRAGERYVEGYRLCIAGGLMNGLPTRIIPNWLPQLEIACSPSLRPYLASPAEAVMQQQFDPSAVVGAALARTCEGRDSLQQCCAFIDRAVNNAHRLWEHGLVDTDRRFPVLENQIVLPDGTIQLYDANNVMASWTEAVAFVQEKQHDLDNIAAKLDGDDYPGLLFATESSSVADAARILYRRLPEHGRDPLVKHFLRCARSTLRDDVLRKHWSAAGNDARFSSETNNCCPARQLPSSNSQLPFDA